MRLQKVLRNVLTLRGRGDKMLCAWSRQRPQATYPPFGGNRPWTSLCRDQSKALLSSEQYDSKPDRVQVNHRKTLALRRRMADPLTGACSGVVLALRRADIVKPLHSGAADSGRGVVTSGPRISRWGCRKAKIRVISQLWAPHTESRIGGMETPSPK
jgi:hypothetical protein